ncbi:MAG TPA: hypothetical protein IAD07_00365 [Candidatus Fimivicinus intestinavium]|nr:hypothetical protein [Candidatus Fimivicinus intestinavium]
MRYPYKYPYLYGELAMQGKTKKELAQALHITTAGLRYRQAMDTDGDFHGEEMKAAASYLQRPVEYLFALEESGMDQRGLQPHPSIAHSA